MPRFFVEDIREGMVFVGGEDGRHMVRSLRMRATGPAGTTRG